MKSVYILFLLATSLYSQPLNYTDNRIEGYYYEINGAEFILNNESYTITKDVLHIDQKVNGRKIFLKSEDMKYYAVANFDFSEEGEYPVTVDIYDNDFNYNRYSFNSFSGLPHPSLNLTDDGKLLLFDPLTYLVTELSPLGKKEYNIEKSVDFEMERSFFTIIKNGSFYLLISERPVSPEEDGENVYLYASDLSFQNIKKTRLDIEVPVYLGTADFMIIASGIKFNDNQVLAKSYIVDGMAIKEVQGAFEKIVEYNDIYAAKFGNSLFLLGNDFNILSSRSFDNNIMDIAVNDSELYVITNDGGWKLININTDLSTKHDFLLSASTAGKIPVLLASEEKLLLYDNTNTYILNEFVRRNK